MTPAADSHPGPCIGHSAPAAELLRMVFTSRSSAPMSPLALEDLVRTCRRRNGEAAITGLLIHHQGCFLQCFEGAPRAIRSAYARIYYDDRHRDIDIRLTEPAAARTFGSWYLAYANVGGATWDMLDGADWVPADVATMALSRGLVLLARAWDLYRNTGGADRGPPGF